MKKMKFNTVATRTAAAVFLAGLMMAAQSAMACTLQSWSAAVGLDETDASLGTIAPGAPNPGGTDEVLSPRYSGRCAMAASGQGYVEDVSPGGIDRIRARFYVLANHTSDAVLYQGLNGGGSEVFRVLFLADGRVRLRSGGVNADADGPDAGNLNEWNSIEIDWDAGADEMSILVNGDGPAPVSFPGAETVSKVRLGNLNSATGTMNFDAYESRRTTPIGELVACDAQGDGSINVLDALAVINEINDAGLATGQPDCSLDGAVNVLDALDIINIINS